MKCFFESLLKYINNIKLQQIINLLTHVLIVLNVIFARPCNPHYFYNDNHIYFLYVILITGIYVSLMCLF